MKNNLLVSFLRSERSFPFTASSLLLLLLLFYRAFSLQPGLSDSGHSFELRSTLYTLVLLISFYLGEVSFRNHSLIWRRLAQYLIGFYLLFCMLNYFWLGQDWQLRSIMSLFKDYSLFWLLLLPLEFFRNSFKSQPKEKEQVPERLVFRDELGRQEFRIALQDLEYIRAEGNYVQIFYRRNEVQQQKLIRQKLKNCLREYPGHLQQIHRSILVNPSAVAETYWHSKNSYLVLNSGVKLKVGNAYRQSLAQVLQSV